MDIRFGDIRSRTRRALATLAVAPILAPTVRALRSRSHQYLPRRARVLGESMRPTLEPNDRLLMVPCRDPHPGDLVVLTDPRTASRVLVKRVTSVGPSSLEVAGDQSRASTDSRTFGPVARTSVWGRVIYTYAPASRVRTWHRAPRPK